MKATEGHSVILNFSTIPAWMFKTDKPVTFPDDPNQVFWNYTQGTELRDPTMKEARTTLRASLAGTHRRLHRRIWQAPRVGTPLQDPLLGSPERN